MLTFNCPRWTSNSLLQEVLIRNKTSFKTDLLSRYDKFYKSQRTSFSQEVRVFLLFLYTTTSNNMKVMMVQLETDVRTVSAGKLKPELHTNPLVDIPPPNKWKMTEQYFCISFTPSRFPLRKTLNQIL